MKEQNIRIMIMSITSVMATFVLYLCSGVSELLPLFIAVILAVFTFAFACSQCRPFSELVRFTQKRE